LYSAQNKSSSVDILKDYLTDYDKANIDIHKSIEATATHFGNEKECGFLKPERVAIFLKWLVEHNLENKAIIGQHLFTNELLKH
jgi:hypothetical protein